MSARYQPCRPALKHFAAGHDAPGAVQSNARRRDPANPSASYPACFVMERPSASESAMRHSGMAKSAVQSGVDQSQIQPS